MICACSNLLKTSLVNKCTEKREACVHGIAAIIPMKYVRGNTL